MLNKDCRNMESKNSSIQENYLKYLIEIKSINDFIYSIENFLASATLGVIEDVLEKNYMANDILTSLTENLNQYNLDKFLSFWVYECALSLKKNGDLKQSKIFDKYDFLYKSIDTNPVSNISVDFSAFEKIMVKQRITHSKYLYKEDSVIILTAAPIEFISIIRNLSHILMVSDKTDLIRILNPDIPINDKNLNRQSIWVSGVIQSNSKWVKVMILLVSEYGSVSVGTYLSAFKKEYKYRNEILLMGIAGQLDKSKNVKIGHLVISDGFYDAYFQKIEEDGINYKNKTPIPTCSEYDSPGFQWSLWKSKHTTNSPPIPEGQDPIRFCSNKTVHKGKFVSFHAVNKQTYSKENLMDTFKDCLAVEMEATGCYKFINEHQRHLKLKIIKAVCDWSDESKSKEWQPYCAELAAEFTVDYLISKYGNNLDTQ